MLLQLALSPQWPGTSAAVCVHARSDRRDSSIALYTGSGCHQSRAVGAATNYHCNSTDPHIAISLAWGLQSITLDLNSCHPWLASAPPPKPRHSMSAELLSPLPPDRPACHLVHTTPFFMSNSPLQTFMATHGGLEVVHGERRNTCRECMVIQFGSSCAHYMKIWLPTNQVWFWVPAYASQNSPTTSCALVRWLCEQSASCTSTENARQPRGWGSSVWDAACDNIDWH